MPTKKRTVTIRLDTALDRCVEALEDAKAALQHHGHYGDVGLIDAALDAAKKAREP